MVWGWLDKVREQNKVKALFLADFTLKTWKKRAYGGTKKNLGPWDLINRVLEIIDISKSREQAIINIQLFDENQPIGLRSLVLVTSYASSTWIDGELKIIFNYNITIWGWLMISGSPWFAMSKSLPDSWSFWDIWSSR